jgi:hypothetical protein
MRRTLLLLLAIVLLPKLSLCQVFIEPFGGYQVDLNNHGKNKLINSGVQLALKKRRYEFLVQIQKSWTAKETHYSDSSFTTNPSLPLYAPAEKKLTISSFSLGIGNRIKVAGRKSNNSLFVKLYIGAMYQKIKVNYQYDKSNYIVLNPDETEEQTGVYVSMGLEYMRQLKTGRLFFDVNFSSPPSGHPSFPAYKFVAPLSFNIGYSIQLSKKHHEK